MDDSKLSSLDTIPAVDRAADYLYIVDTSGSTSNKVTPNGLLGFSGGNPVSTTDSQTLTNKTLTAPTINTPTLTVNDDSLTLQDNSDTTKKAAFQLSGITTGNTRTITVPDASLTLVGLTTTQTLTNKTLTAPTITNPTLTVDTISEFTSANGVTIDSMLIKDGTVGPGTITPAGLVAGTGSTWVWPSWTPTWTNVTVGNGTVVAKYIQMGKTVHFRVKLTFGSTSAVSGDFTFSTPVTMSSNYAQNDTVNSSAVMLDSGTQGYVGMVIVASTTTLNVRPVNASATTSTYGAAASSTVPHTWATNDIIQACGSFEAA
jgi:hypothetical protein